MTKGTILIVVVGPHRMRKKLCQNDVFYVHYEYNKNKEPEVMEQLRSSVACFNGVVFA